MNLSVNLIFELDWWEVSDNERKKHIIYELDGVFYILIDESAKILDVSKMPKYIQEDYLKYNSNILEENHIDNILAKINWWIDSNNDETSQQVMSEPKLKEYEKSINILKGLKIDLKIKKIFS